MDEPVRLTLGDTWAWTRTQPDYPASAGWQLTYYFSQPGGTAVVQVVTSAQGADYAAAVPATDTADPAKWTPGLWNWTARVAKAGETHTVGTGKTRIYPDPATAITAATHAEKCLAIIESALERCLGSDVVEYELDGVKFKKNRTELLALRNAYRQEVRQERGQLGIRIVPVSLR